MTIKTGYIIKCPNCDHSVSGTWKTNNLREFYLEFAKCSKCGLYGCDIIIYSQIDV